MAFASVWGFALVGIDAVPVRVEAHARSGLPGVTIVGLPGAAVKEAKERIRSGAASSGFPLPTRRITINLSPGDVPKDGSGFDLPIALATLAACGYLSVDALRGVGAAGEVSLDGVVRPTRGALSVVEGASRARLNLLIAPIEWLAVAAMVEAVRVVAVRSLEEAILALKEPSSADRLLERGRRWVNCHRRHAKCDAQPQVDLSDVTGHRQVKRALEIAAAGGHHLLMIGPPGTGKTMLARRMPGILPPLTRAEALDVTRIWGAAGLRNSQLDLASERPFRAPHHTASRAALVGGGALLRPGEVSLAHHGVLFLDELPEFSRDALEALRQPLEEGCVTISRRVGNAVFPARCALIAAMNPCPCGYLGHPEKACRCSGAAIERYRSRISGPLLDRIEVLVEVPPLSLTTLQNHDQPESSDRVRRRVTAARAFRDARLAAEKPVTAGTVPTGVCATDWQRDAPRSLALEQRSGLAGDARALLHQALASQHLSGRGYVRVIGLARTIADLDESLIIRTEHVAEALSLRLDYRRVEWG